MAFMKTAASCPSEPIHCVAVLCTARQDDRPNSCLSPQNNGAAALRVLVRLLARQTALALWQAHLQAAVPPVNNKEP